jgi:hypothetical protein
MKAVRISVNAWTVEPSARTSERVQAISQRSAANPERAAATRGRTGGGGSAGGAARRSPSRPRESFQEAAAIATLSTAATIVVARSPRSGTSQKPAARVPRTPPRVLIA